MSVLRFGAALLLLAAVAVAQRSRCGQRTNDPAVREFLKCTCAEAACKNSARQLGKTADATITDCTDCMDICTKLSRSFNNFRNRKNRLRRANRRCKDTIL